MHFLRSFRPVHVSCSRDLKGNQFVRKLLKSFLIMLVHFVGNEIIGATCECCSIAG